MEKLLESVTKLAKRSGFDDFETATAQSLAWYYRSCYEGPELPDGHWAWVAVRGVRNGRDLPGCGTGNCDALHHAWQGQGMGEVMDRSPGPALLAEQKETMEFVLVKVSPLKREVAVLKQAGMRGKAIAVQLNISQARVSQICRELTELFEE